uniref:Minor capsid protein n=1 Tax=Gokushovirinae environmental samples TaxID=1478972 RepID=A0A2R3UAE5_9VIRU|nr:minor capsid protein [Gokushovirinae environmental samples]
MFQATWTDSRGADFIPALIAAGAAITGAAINSAAGAAANSANIQEAEKNRQWQQQMSNTAHQREVADLRSAGLNPMLSANGGASTPGGAQARVEPAPFNPMEAVNAALAMKNSIANVENTEADTAVKQELKTGAKLNNKITKNEATISDQNTKVEKYTSPINKILDTVGSAIGSFTGMGRAVNMLKSIGGQSAKGMTMQQGFRDYMRSSPSRTRP